MSAAALNENESQHFDGILRRSIDITVRSIDDASRSVHVIASTDTLDSHGDILEQDWQLDRYLKNPVVLWNHNLHRFEGGCRPEDTLPIGRGEDVAVVAGKLQAKLIFPPADLSELGDRVFRMFKSDFIHAVSVGFKPGTVTEEFLDGRRIFRLAQNELREISVVPMGSNPDAVAKAIEVEREHLRRIVRGEPFAPSPAPGPSDAQRTVDAIHRELGMTHDPAQLEEQRRAVRRQFEAEQGRSADEIADDLMHDVLRSSDAEWAERERLIEANKREGF